MRKLIVPFFISHRGCPHRCVFCDQVKISGSPEQIPGEAAIRAGIDEYRRACPDSNIEVAFFGGSFTSLPPGVQEQLLVPLQPLLKGGVIGSVRISTRPDSVDTASVAFLKKWGVAVVELGVQSMDDEVLAASGRGHGRDTVEAAVASLKNAGLAVGIQLMPGLPGDSPAKSVHSLRRVLAVKPDFLRIYPTVVLGGTPLQELFDRGAYRPQTLDEAVQLCKILLHECLLANVPVIRMGLQPTSELLTAGVIVAGPWHPAFRQLVESELCFDLLAAIVTSAGVGASAIHVSCSPSRVSDVIGQKRATVDRLQRQFGVRIASVTADPKLSVLELTVASEKGVAAGNILKDLHYKLEESCNA